MCSKKLSLVLCAVLFVHTVVASSCGSLTQAERRYFQNLQPNTYEGNVITPGILQQLQERENPLPPRIERKVKNFVSRKKLGRLLSGADQQQTFYCGQMPERVALRDALDAELAKAGVKNLAVNSYTFDVPNADAVLKKTRVPVSRHNLLVTSDCNKWEGRPAWDDKRIPTQDEFDRWKEELKGRIYQNTSRAMVALRAQEAIRKLGLDHLVTVPKTYLVHIPGRPYEIDDTNYIVVEKKFGEQTKWEEHPLALDEDTIRAMVKLIASTGWWTMNHAAGVVDDKICYYDNELPNAHAINQVFFKGKKGREHFRQLVQIGWNELEDQIMKPYAEQHKDDPEIQAKFQKVLAEKRALQEEIKACWK